MAKEHPNRQDVCFSDDQLEKSQKHQDRRRAFVPVKPNRQRKNDQNYDAKFESTFGGQPGWKRQLLPEVHQQALNPATAAPDHVQRPSRAKRHECDTNVRDGASLAICGVALKLPAHEIVETSRSGEVRSRSLDAKFVVYCMQLFRNAIANNLLLAWRERAKFVKHPILSIWSHNIFRIARMRIEPVETDRVADFMKDHVRY